MTDRNADGTTGDGRTDPATADPDADLPTDDVLRVLSQAGIGVSPAVVAANLAEVRDDPPSEAAVASGLDELAANDLVRELDAGGVYALSDRGRDYVEAELDAGAPGYVD